ncbi:hypothetical protein [Streptomyces sp. NPDC056069]
MSAEARRRTGALPHVAGARRWVAGLAEGPFHASFTLVTVVARRSREP